MAKSKKKKPKATALPPLGRLGAERWIAVRQKSGAGPIEPASRKGTRTEHERGAIDGQLDAREGKDD